MTPLSLLAGSTCNSCLQKLIYDVAGLIYNKVSFLKSLEPSHDVLQLLEKNVYSALILHLLKPLFSAFHVLQALGIFFS